MNENSEIFDHKSALYSLDQFAVNYPLYPNIISSVFQILRDLMIKQSYYDMKITNGESFGFLTYIIDGISRSDETRTFFLPMAMDKDIPLKRLWTLCDNLRDGNTLLCLCIYTSESITYQMVTHELP